MSEKCAKTVEAEAIQWRDRDAYYCDLEAAKRAEELAAMPWLVEPTAPGQRGSNPKATERRRKANRAARKARRRAA